VENVQDFWSDPLTAAGAQSPDGKAAYVQVFLVGAQGTTPSHEAVASVRDLVSSVPAAAGSEGLRRPATRCSTPTPSVAGHKSLQLMALVSIGVILVMLLIVYRSIVTTILGAPGSSASNSLLHKGLRPPRVTMNIIGLTPYAVSMITMLAIAAGTDYVIFLLGRYHEARAAGRIGKRPTTPRITGCLT